MDKLQHYCCNCETMQPTEIIEKLETLNVKGREITLNVHVRVCNTCGEEILDTGLDNKTLERFYDEYKKLENLLLPKDIKAIRQKYNLSQVSFAKFLGFGEKTITRYENGAIQDVCHDNLIRLVDSIEVFLLLWKERKNCLTDKEQMYINSILEAHNKVKFNCNYRFNSNYFQDSYNMYVVNRGEIPYAG